MATTLTAPREALRRRRLQLAPEPGRQETRPAASIGSLIGWVWLAIGVLVLAFVGYLLGASRLQAQHAQAVRYPDVVRSLAEATVPVSGAIKPGTPLGLLRIPSIGVDQVLVQGSAAQQTAVAPGLRSDTALPGQAGLSVVVGRRATYGAPFRHLDRLHEGSTITVVTGQGRFHYVVDVVRTTDAPSTKVPVVDSRLTLMTSDPVLTPDRSLVVSAVLSGHDQPAATSRVTRPDETPGSGSGARTVALLLWAQLLVVVSALATWAAMRFPKRAIWIGAAPVLLAVLWNVFDNLALLLPNTL